MRRFSRKRRGEAGRKGSEAIDGARWFGRLAEEGVIPVSGIEVLSEEGISDRFAAVGRGEVGSGGAAVVAFSPTRAEDALLAALATGMRLSAEESFEGAVFAVAPVWSISARRRLGLVRAELPFEFRSVAAAGLQTGAPDVEAEADLEPSAVALDAVGMRLADPAERALFGRAAQSLQGLASKHGGAIRAVGRSIELVVLAQRIAELRADDEASALYILDGQRRSMKLADGSLAATFDDLEGQIRRRLNDKKMRGSEEALRTKIAKAVAIEAGLRDVREWPLGGADRDVIDLVGLRADGQPVAMGGRNSFDLAALGHFLDGLQKLRLAIPALFAGAPPPVRLETPELILAAKEFSPAALRAVSALAVAHGLYEVRAGRDQSVSLTPVGAEEAVRSKKDAPSRRRRSAGRPTRGEGAGPAAASESAAAEAGEDPGSGGRDSTRRRGRRRGRGRERPDEADEKPAESRDRPGFDEVSLFDLDESDAKDGRRLAGRTTPH